MHGTGSVVIAPPASFGHTAGEEVNFLKTALSPFVNDATLNVPQKESMSYFLKNGTLNEKEKVFQRLERLIALPQLVEDLKNDLCKIRNQFLSDFRSDFLNCTEIEGKLNKISEDQFLVVSTINYAWGGNLESSIPLAETVKENIATLKEATLAQFTDNPVLHQQMMIEFNNFVQGSLYNKLDGSKKQSYPDLSDKSYEYKKLAVLSWTMQKH